MSAPKPPPYVICYLCGRKYGTKSIAIHEPSCIKKWREENRKLPKHLRRKMPTKPDYSILASSNYNESAVDQMNEMAYQAAQEQLIPCEHCGRTFYPEKLAVHQRSCTSENPARRPKTVTKSRNAPLTTQVPSTNSNEQSYMKQNQVKNKPNTYPPKEKKPQVNNSENGPTIPCALCQGQIQANEIAQHLMKCNEERTKHLQNNSDSRSETVSVSRKTERPSTRTLHRGPPTEAANNAASNKEPPTTNHATYDIDSSDEKPHKTKTNAKPRKSSYTKPNYPTYDVDSPEEAGPADLTECHICNRKFASDRISKHMVICKRTTSKGRKIFDSSKQRLEGTEAAQHYSKNAHKAKPAVPKSNWRQTHQDFIRSIRAAKQVTTHMAKGGKASDLPPPPPSLNPDYVYCQYCDRRFNPEVAERHIPRCATIQNRPKPPKAKALEIYRPPPTKKTTSRPQGRAPMQQKSYQDSYKSSNTTYSSPKYHQNSAKQSSEKQSSNYGRPSSNTNYSPRYEGYTSPREQVNNSYRPLSKQANNNSVKGRSVKINNDPYKAKTFSGIDHKKPASRGYSYNAMNYTSPNFFG